MKSQPHISEIKIGNKPTVVLGITPRTPKNYDPLELSRQALTLRDELRNSESVSLVYDDILKKQIQILLNKDKMKEYQITFEEVYELIHRDQIRLSAGNIESDNEVKGIVTLSERKTPSESNLDYTETQAESIEKVINGIPEGTVRSYITKIGDGSFNNFRIEIILTPFFDRELNADQVREVIIQGVQKAELNLKSIGYFINSGGPPSGKPIEINIFHPNKEVRKAVISGIMINLQSNSIFSEINTDYGEGLQEIQVIPKPETYYSGISAERIA